MAVKIIEETESKLSLEIDNGDLSKLKDVMNKWNFKNYQSLLRFSVSILILNESKSFGIKTEGFEKEVVPSKDLLKDN